MKVLAMSSIRSDYDLLSPLYRLLDADKDIDFKLLISGAHLSTEFGYTKQYIEKDGFSILAEIETLINSDTLRSKLKTASIFLQNSIDIVSGFNPDIILYAGDREDVIMGGLLGLYLNIPTIHFYGGDHEVAGHEDTVIRHATSKLSTYHFVSNSEHKERLLRMGESENRIYDIGSISLDRFKIENRYDKESIADTLELKKYNLSSLVIYHPSPSSLEDDAAVFDNILKSLKKQEIFSFVSYPNTDSNKSKIVEVIDRYKDDDGFYFFKNLDRDIFLSIFKTSEFIIGNSSAGIYEAASIPIGAINVGYRQKDRMSGENVIFCDISEDSISRSIKKVLSNEFKSSIDNMVNPYGDGNSADRAYRLIKNIEFKKLLKKVEDPLCL